MGRPGGRVGEGWEVGVGVGLVLGVLAAALAVDHAVAGAHLAVGLGLVACLAGIARAQGLTAAELGLARSSWPDGLRWGAVAAAVVAAAYALGFLVAPLRDALPHGEPGIGRGALWLVLVVIPLGTVVPEELAFRGVLLAVLGRHQDLRTSTVVSSALFGLWHIAGSLGGGTANATIAGAVGADVTGMTLRVAATVLFTSLAGVVLCWLRLRSGSLLAPVLAHWTVNGLGVIVALVA